MSIAVIRNGQIQETDDDDFDVEFLSPNQFLSTHVNQIPLQNAVSAPRLFYGARFYNQAVPLVNPETPLVQNLVDGTEQSFDELLGEQMGAVRAKGAGTVRKITPDFIEVEDAETKEVSKVNLYNNMPFNRKTMVTNTPLVQEGDTIEPGQLLAKSNYTDDQGRVAMGLNARIGLVPYKGHSMDDAVVISESFAKRLTSQQAYSDEVDFSDGTKGGLKHFVSLFPTEYTKEQLANFDENGVVKPGTILNPGDPYILATKPRMITSNMGAVGKLSRAMANTRQNASRVWDHEDPAEVVDVAQTRKGFKVIVKSETPAKVGDKMVERHGQKSYHPDTEFLTERGWVRPNELLDTDRVAALFDRNEGSGPQNLYGKFVEPSVLYSYVFDGELYGMESRHAAYLTTGNHRIWRRGHTKGCSRYSALDASEVEGKNQRFLIAAPFELDRKDPEIFTLPEAVSDKTGEVLDHPCVFPFATWVRFMALYLSEGNIRHTKKSDYTVVITQKEREFCRILEKTLEEMGLTWTKTNNQYVTSPCKPLRLYLEQFGKAPDKHVPVEIKKASKPVIQMFLDTLWQCDGDKNKGKAYWSCSKRMVDDVQFLLQLLGKASNVNSREPRDHQNYGERCVWICGGNEAGVGKKAKDSYYREKYHGKVYCLQVPGLGVLLTRFRDKVMWNGNSIVSKIIPDSQMPRTTDGEPLEVLLNPMGIPSRVNDSTPLDLLLGKVAKKRGEPFRLGAFNQKGESWVDFVERTLAENELSDVEEVFDPSEQRKLENPVTVGYGHILKLHHMGESKISSRSQGAYDSDAQPLKGGSEAAQAKRLSTLELGALLSSGAYATMREGATLRGQQNDDYWRAIRQGQTPKEPGEPFAWEKFKALLTGSGLYARNLGDGRLRLGPFTDRELAKRNPARIERGGLVDPVSLEPEPGGLFDPALVGNNRWGKIELSSDMPNPAFEKQIALLLGIKQKDLERVVSGEITLEEAREK